MKSTSKLIDITRATQTGPLVTEREFDFRIIPAKLKQLAEDHEIIYTPERPVPNDLHLADEVYQAAFEFLAEIGILCIDSGRIIKFDDNEIREAAGSGPDNFHVGAYNDRRQIRRRGIEEGLRPTVIGGLGGGIVTQRYYEEIIASIAAEPVVDAVCGGSLTEVDGGPIVRNSPIEMHAALFEAECMRKAVARTNRPGLCVLAGSPEGAAAVISAFEPNRGYRKSDMAISCLVYPMKTTLNLLNKTKYFIEYGCPIFSYADHLIGGYTGGPTTTAISMVAHCLANQLINWPNIQEISCQDIRYNNTSSRMSIWTHSLVAQAIARNTKIITTSESFASAGPCTEMILYEAIAPALAVVSGANAGPGPAGCSTKEIDRFTGLEARFFGKTVEALAGRKLDFANEIALKILEKYEAKFASPPQGRRFNECYQATSLKPTSEWINILDAVTKEMREVGLEIQE